MRARQPSLHLQHQPRLSFSTSLPQQVHDRSRPRLFPSIASPPLLPSLIDQQQQRSCPLPPPQSKESHCLTPLELSCDTTSGRLPGGREDEVERARSGAKSGGAETSAQRSIVAFIKVNDATLTLLSLTQLPRHQPTKEGNERLTDAALSHWRGKAGLTKAAHGRARAVRSFPRGLKPPPRPHHFHRHQRLMSERGCMRAQ